MQIKKTCTSSFATTFLLTIVFAAAFSTVAFASHLGPMATVDDSSSSEDIHHHSASVLALSGIWWALSGFLIAIGLTSLLYFWLLVQTNAIESFTTLVGWVFAIWALLTVLFVGTTLILAFTIY